MFSKLTIQPYAKELHNNLKDLIHRDVGGRLPFIDSKQITEIFSKEFPHNVIFLLFDEEMNAKGCVYPSVGGADCFIVERFPTTFSEDVKLISYSKYSSTEAFVKSITDFLRQSAKKHEVDELIDAYNKKKPQMTIWDWLGIEEKEYEQLKTRPTGKIRRKVLKHHSLLK
jgi:hypothetical protein